MKGLDEVAGKLKKKLSFDDYDTKELLPQPVNTSTHQNAKEGKKKDSKKVKYTVYLTDEADRQFTEVYTKNLLDRSGKDRSTLMCEAVSLLHKQSILQSSDN